jgi:ABC-type branched-subunit amino acid transport system substrate-binding protein
VQSDPRARCVTPPPGDRRARSVHSAHSAHRAYAAARPLGALACVTVLALVAAACTSHTTPNAGGTGPAPTVASSVKLVNAENVSCPAEITSTCLTVGNIATISGIVPGLFEGASVGTDAYMSYLDSTQGGIDGRKIQLIADDDKFNGDLNASETQSLIGRVIAYVGSFSLEDQDGGVVLSHNPGIPNVSLSLSQYTLGLSNTISPLPAVGGWQLGPLEWFKAHYPNAVKHVGLLIAQEASAETQANGLEAAMKHLGFDIVYTSQFGPLQSNFETELLAMQHAGVQYLDLTLMDATDAEHILTEIHSQGYHPQVIESGGPIYVDNFVQQSGGAANTDGIYLDQTVSLYLGGDAKSVPEVNTFLSWVRKVRPGFAPDLFTLYGWISGMLFAEGMEHAGSNPTSSSLLAALRQIRSFDAGGLVAKSDPGGKQPPSCWLLARIQNGIFVRVSPSPKAGFICNAPYFKT